VLSARFSAEPRRPLRPPERPGGCRERRGAPEKGRPQARGSADV